MEGRKRLLSKYKVSETIIESNFDENDNHDAPFVFSAKFWADPSLVSIESLKKLNFSASLQIKKKKISEEKRG